MFGMTRRQAQRICSLPLPERAHTADIGATHCLIAHRPALASVDVTVTPEDFVKRSSTWVIVSDDIVRSAEQYQDVPRTANSRRWSPMTQHTDFYKRLDDLQEQVVTARSAVRAAAAESDAQLRQRIEQAQADLDQSAENARQQVSQAADTARATWAQVKADAAAKMNDVKANVDRRNRQVDAKVAAKEADCGRNRLGRSARLRRLGGRERTAGDARRHPRSRLRRQAREGRSQRIAATRTLAVRRLRPRSGGQHGRGADGARTPSVTRARCPRRRCPGQGLRRWGRCPRSEGAVGAGGTALQHVETFPPSWRGSSPGRTSRVSVQAPKANASTLEM